MSNNLGVKMKKVWLVGAGVMAQDYIKVLNGLDYDFLVIGRGESNSTLCKNKLGCETISGGLEKFLSTNPEKCTYAIVAVGVDRLYKTTKNLLNYGIKNILVEKPGALRKEEFGELNDLARKIGSNLLVAYNRRFYAAVLKAEEIIQNDGGITSFNFEFTEWAHEIEALEKPQIVKEKWFLANSTHVVDLAFYLGGKPKELFTYTSGSLNWHPSASIFNGSGISEKNALFSYQANWESAGRWSVEILTKEHRLILRPMEKLQIQKRGSIAQEFDENIDYTLDEKYKPGLYLQTKNFLEGSLDKMCDIQEQFKMIDIYNKMANYITC